MGPIFLIDKTLYFLEKHSYEPSNIHAKFNLEEKKLVEDLNIPFENVEGYDSSLTYYDEY